MMTDIALMAMADIHTGRMMDPTTATTLSTIAHGDEEAEPTDIETAATLIGPSERPESIALETPKRTEVFHITTVQLTLR